jgi:hypothetical protein
MARQGTGYVYESMLERCLSWIRVSLVGMFSPSLFGWCLSAGYRGVHELWNAYLGRRLYLVNAQESPLALSHKVAEAVFR